MILVLTLALAVCWGLARGGHPAELHSFPLRGLVPAVLAFTIQAGLIYLPAVVILGNAGHLTLLVVSYALAAWFVWANRRLPGMWLLGVGLAANWLVILANGGYMPITYEALAAAGQLRLASSTATGTIVLSSKDILLPLAETRLAFLADRFVIPPPFPIPGVFSVGDALIGAGLFWLVPYALGVGRTTLLPDPTGLGM